ncbi:MAG: CBS domain-containing protein [Thermoanaerobaculia bacterium]
MQEKNARDLMRPPLHRVGDDMSLVELARVMLDTGMSEVAVQDAGGRIVGVVTAADVAAADPDTAHLSDRRRRNCFFFELQVPAAPAALRRVLESSSRILLRDILNNAVYSVPDETPLRDIAEIMVDSQIHRLLVTRSGEMVGLVTSDDLLRLFFGEPPAPPSPR